MGQIIEKTGKTVEEAKAAALAELGLSESEVAIEIIDEPSKGILGFFGKDAKIRVTVLGDEVGSVGCYQDEESVQALIKNLADAEENKSVQVEAKEQEDYSHEERRSERKTFPAPADIENSEQLKAGLAFLTEIFRHMNMDVKLEPSVKENGVRVGLVGENLGILIGKHGQTLDALQYLCNLVANKVNHEERLRIIIDIEDYRTRREETLVNLASRLAGKAIRTGHKVTLEPMNRRERKIIHMALQGNDRITTYSAGDEPFRKVVIEPKNVGEGGYHRPRRYERGGYGRRNSYRRGDIDFSQRESSNDRDEQ